MGSISKKTVTKPLTARQRTNDNSILRLLADRRARSARTMAEHFSVSETTIRKWLLRLTMAQAVSREAGRYDAQAGFAMLPVLHYAPGRGGIGESGR